MRSFQALFSITVTKPLNREIIAETSASGDLADWQIHFSNLGFLGLDSGKLFPKTVPRRWGLGLGGKGHCKAKIQRKLSAMRLIKIDHRMAYILSFLLPGKECRYLL